MNMTPTIKPKYASTIHRDNTVSYWDVYLQQWQRTSVFAIVNKHDVFASLPESDRAKINAASLPALVKTAEVLAPGAWISRWRRTVL